MSIRQTLTLVALATLTALALTLTILTGTIDPAYPYDQHPAIPPTATVYEDGSWDDPATDTTGCTPGALCED